MIDRQGELWRARGAPDYTLGSCLSVLQHEAPSTERTDPFPPRGWETNSSIFSSSSPDDTSGDAVELTIQSFPIRTRLGLSESLFELLSKTEQREEGVLPLGLVLLLVTVR